jgi:hypothetical protein
MMRVPPEPFALVRVRQKLPLDQWRISVDEKLRRRDYELAGYEPLPDITLTLARQQEHQP